MVVRSMLFRSASISSPLEILDRRLLRARESVPQAVRVACRAQLRRAHALLEDIADCGAQQRAIRAARPQEELGMCPSLSLALNGQILA